jgi:hypothetical protein
MEKRHLYSRLTINSLSKKHHPSGNFPINEFIAGLFTRGISLIIF